MGLLPSCPGLKSQLRLCLLCDLGKVAELLCASAFFLYSRAEKSGQDVVRVTRGNDWWVVGCCPRKLPVPSMIASDGPETGPPPSLPAPHPCAPTHLTHKDTELNVRAEMVQLLNKRSKRILNRTQQHELSKTKSVQRAPWNFYKGSFLRK